MPYGEVTVGGQLLSVKPFAWPSAVMRYGVHVTAEGRLYEVDSATRVSAVDLEVEGTEREGWAVMTEAAKGTIETQYRAGLAVTVTDWRGNTGTFLYAEAPEFEPVAAAGEGAVSDSYYRFRLKMRRVT